MKKTVFLGFAAVFCGLISVLPAEEAAPLALSNKPHWRHPIAMVAVGDRIYVANQKSGSVSVVDAAELKVLAEQPVGQRLTDLAILQNGKCLVAIDEAAHQLILLNPMPAGVKVLKRLNVAKSPVGLAINSQGTRCAVASLWSWRVTLFESVSTKKTEHSLQKQAVIDLPFAPRKMLWLKKEHRLIVADAFGGRLAVIDPIAAKLLFVKTLAGHNIRGLALSRNGKDLLIAQQVLDANSKTMHTPVFWGDLMQNVMRSQALEEFLSAKAKPQNTGDLFRTEPLGHPSNATGDPSDVIVLPRGQTVVSLSGVGEIAIRRSDTKPFERFDAQAHSTDLLLHPDGERLLVANTFADSITIFDLKSWGIAGHVSLGPTSTLNQREQGERLFYDSRLSLDGWYSCHSCHTDGHTTGKRNDNLSDYSFGAPKRILPLGGVSETGPWAWNGKANNLADQIHSSIKNTMQGKPRPEKDVAALVAYLETLKPAPSLDQMRDAVDAAAVKRGEKVFHNQSCANCHQPPTYTTPETYNIGLVDETGQQKFNPPSLQGVSQRQELFHDSRAKSLHDVLQKHQHGDAHLLSDKKRKDLIAFLRSL